MCGQQEVNGNEPDVEPSVENNALESNIDLNDGLLSHLTENGSMRVQQLLNGNDPSNLVSSDEPPLSMGEILLSLDAGIPLPGPGAEYSKDRHSNKPNGTQQHGKRSNLWGRSNVSYPPPPPWYRFILLECYISKAITSYSFSRENITRNTLL